MANQAEILMQEISELREQYVAEVGKGRRVWPRSIKERVAALDEMGVSARQIADSSGVGYATILQWRFKRRQKLGRSFHEVAIAEPAMTKAIAKFDTVTVPQDKIRKMRSQNISKLSTVTLTTPDGYKIEAPDSETALMLLERLRSSSCS